MTKKKQVSDLEEAKASANSANKMHRQLSKVAKQIDSLEEMLAIIRNKRERKAIDSRVHAFMTANLRENLLSRKAKEFGSALEVSAIDMQAALLHAQAAIASYVSTWNETLDEAHAANKKAN